MGYIDLRDIINNKKAEPEVYETWRKALEKEGIDDMMKQANNEPTFIPDYEFEDYARELAEDIGAIGKDGEWPTNCIDWEQASNELKIDYSEIEVDGTTYYYRNY